MMRSMILLRITICLLSLFITIPTTAQFTNVPITGEEISGYEFVVDNMSFRILDVEAKEVALIDRSRKFHAEGFGDYTHLKEVPSSVEFENEVYSVVAISGVSCMFSKELFLPDSIIEIGNGCFEHTDWIDFQFPKSLKNIGRLCFNQCNEMLQFNLPQSLQTIGADSFKDNLNIKKIDFGTNLRSIGENSFSNNPNLFEVKLPNSLMSISKGCFNNCRSLEYVRLPRWLPYEYSSRGDLLEIFNGCSAIKVIEWESETPMALPNCFKNVHKEACIVIVPDGSIHKYQDNEYWRQFNVIEKSQYKSDIKDICEETSDDSEYFLFNGTKVFNKTIIPLNNPYIEVKGNNVTKRLNR